ncbi:MAG: NAD(P)H-dependent oxidoreductase [Thermoflexales bacterium]|nr:NAD(P)H-dependent oxidoreductase [Thermoflexales bacterium]
MKAFIVYWHPEPQSFNAAMFQTACEALATAGHDVKTSNLYEMQFDPVSSRKNFATVKDPDYLKLQLEEMHATANHGFSAEIEAEIEKMEWCDLMIWQFPLWWFGLPAVLKGWADRVLAMGRAYGGGRVYQNGVFGGKRAFLSLTTGGSEDAFRVDGFNGDLAGILRPIHRGILQFTGFTVLAPQVVHGPVRMTDAQRKQALASYASRLQAIGSEAPFEVGSY